MKPNAKTEHIKHLILSAGLLGGLLRALLYLTGTDEKGLLIPWHWAHVGLWAVTAATAVGIVFLCRSIQGSEKYEHSFPVSAAGAAGCAFCAFGMLMSGISGLKNAASSLDVMVVVLSFASAAALGYVGVCRLTRAKPFLAAHAVVCVFLALRMVCQYRIWSSDPQLQDYCFHMAAHVGLMLTAYHFAAFDAGMGSHRKLWTLGLATVYLCLISLYRNQDMLFVLTCGIWVFTNLPSLSVPPRRQRPVMQALEEETREEG